MINNEMHNEQILNRSLREHFGVDVDAKQLIVDNVSVSPTAEATLFLTTKNQLYLYISAKSKLTLGDVKKIVTRMGLHAELFLPPKGRPFYFNEIGSAKFHEVFPGRKQTCDEDIAFYKTLAPYNPALILISEVRDGHVYRYDSDSATGWRTAVKFTYRRIRTS